MKRSPSVTLSICFVLLLVSFCAQGGQSSSAARSPVPALSPPISSPEATVQSSPTRIIPQEQVYIDAKLDFQLTMVYGKDSFLGQPFEPLKSQMRVLFIDVQYRLLLVLFSEERMENF